MSGLDLAETRRVPFPPVRGFDDSSSFKTLRNWRFSVLRMSTRFLRLRIMASLGSMMTKGCVRIFFALAAYLSVFIVSDKLDAAGDTQAICNENVFFCNIELKT